MNLVLDSRAEGSSQSKLQLVKEVRLTGAIQQVQVQQTVCCCSDTALPQANNVIWQCQNFQQCQSSGSVKIE